MNNLAYSSRDPQIVGPKVEELLRKEVGAGSPLSYTVSNGSPAPYTVGSALRDLLVGGDADTAFHLNFALDHPRPTGLHISMAKMGVGCFAGALLYSTRLSKSVAGELALEPPKTFGKSKFAGDVTACARLNANSKLLDLANKFARTESKSGGVTVKQERFFRILPDPGGTLLIIKSLPRTTAMGFSAAVDSKDFFEIAALIEATL